MVTGDPGAHGAQVTKIQENYPGSGHAIDQQPKMEVPPVQGKNMKH